MTGKVGMNVCKTGGTCAEAVALAGWRAGRSGNSRNGHSTKRLKGEDGELEVAVPRDRNASFDPRIIRKGQRRIDGFDDKVISMYARGRSVREIRGHLRELYGVEASPDLISRVCGRS